VFQVAEVEAVRPSKLLLFEEFPAFSYAQLPALYRSNHSDTMEEVRRRSFSANFAHYNPQ